MRPVLYLGCPAGERADCERELGSAGLSIVWTESIASLLAELRGESMPVLIDLSRGSKAVRHAQAVRVSSPSARVFAVVDPARPQLTADAVLAGVTDVLSRPLSGRSVTTAASRQRNRTPHEAPVPGDRSVRSQAMRAVMAMVRRSSTMRAGVLIRGEEGTGRQFLARAIHASQNGDGGPFVVLDCAANAAGSLDRILFGSPAASNGLESVVPGSLLHQAAGGTLYFRHVAELPGRVQARLARVLRDGEASLQGSGHRISLDVRPIAGVDPGFDRAVDEGRVHDDLVRMLSVIGIDMPPLRQRREDIPAIARQLLREICARHHLPHRTLSRLALALLAALPWHGNVIELRALLESIATGPAIGHTIAIDDVVPRLPLNGSSPVPRGETLKMARTKFEREYIAAALEDCHGRISHAAQALGVRRANLYRKIRSLRIVDGVPLRS